VKRPLAIGGLSHFVSGEWTNNNYCVMQRTIARMVDTVGSGHVSPSTVQMSINQRQHIRFSLDIPAIIHTKFGERQFTRLEQISVGGCFTAWEENILVGDEFRMEIELPNRNFLPLHCRALYRFDHAGIGVKFLNISAFEQELISKIIAHKLDMEGVPLQIDPFTLPPTFVTEDVIPKITEIREKRDSILERIMSTD